MNAPTPTPRIPADDRSARPDVSRTLPRCILAEPLAHFMVLGLLLFLGLSLAGAANGDSDGRDIHVDRDILLQFVQLRSKAFDEKRAGAHIDSLSAAERKQLIDEYVREEAAYREAKAWGLDEGDYVVRRRIVQSLEFAARSAGQQAAAPSDQALLAHFQANRAEYAAPPLVSFSHLYFSAERHGWEAARQMARNALASSPELAEDTVVGDRFLYQRNYADARLDLIASQFSEAMAKQLFALSPDAGRWQGPLESAHGVHLIRLIERRAGGAPRFEDVRELVASDYVEKTQQAEQAKFLDAIVKAYRPHISADLAADR